MKWEEDEMAEAEWEGEREREDSLLTGINVLLKVILVEVKMAILTRTVDSRVCEREETTCVCVCVCECVRDREREGERLHF